MEAELLRSKTELMQLNNQLLEAVQKRLELSLELEAWKVKYDEIRKEMHTLKKKRSIICFNGQRKCALDALVSSYLIAESEHLSA